MIIQSTQIWLNEKLTEGQLDIAEGKIVGIYSYNEKPVDIDYGDLWILPGFMDIHTHGFDEVNANKPTAESMDHWCRHMPEEGVTCFVAGTCTQSEEDNKAAMKFYNDYFKTSHPHSEIMGINMEGNFISIECRGAQNKDLIVKPNPETLEEYQKLSGNHILTVTYAPEEDENYAFLNKCKELNIRASIGHSNASYECAVDAVKHGACGITHTGNGMKPFHHRTPGLFGAALNTDELYCECIGDGQHVAFATAHLIGTMKGKDKFILITDSAVEKCNHKYDHLLRDGAYRLENGTLFGSALYINQGVYNLIYKANLPLVTAINAATINPAKYLGYDDRKGSLEVGKDADLVVCNPRIELKQVYCKGQPEF